MLSAKKVKLHGMQDGRWATKDKIIQYKGLINLFTRDRKIMQFDSQVFNKKQQRVLTDLHKNIVTDRQELDNAIRGDKQQIRNALQEHKSLQLAYQELHALQIVDHISQDNFNKRKELDRLGHRMRLKTEVLVKLKLELGELEDRVIYDAPGNLPSEIRSKIVTGQVQDAILKKDAAISVRSIYKQILSIMKKDAIYFDAVLLSLKQDANMQGKCMYRTVQLGQLATEYLDDRQTEFQKLEKFIKLDMKDRDRQVDHIRDTVGGLNKKLRLLIRRDSDLNLAEGAQYRSISELDMLNDLDYTKTIFDRLEETTKVTKYEDVFPIIKAQEFQHKRLMELVERGEKERDTLINKSEHAEYMYYDMLYTMNETTFEYKGEKKNIQDELHTLKEEIKQLGGTIVDRGALLTIVRSSLQQLVQMCRPIRAPGQKRRLLQDTSTENTVEPEVMEEDGLKMIITLSTKLTYLANAASSVPPLLGIKKDVAESYYETLVLQASSVVDTSTVVDDVDGLIEGITVEDSQIPTRDFIKTKSKEIIRMYTAHTEAEAVPEADTKKKKKGFK